MENEEMCEQGQSRREIIKRALKVTAYATPVILTAVVPGATAMAASPPILTGFLTVVADQEPPDEICEGPGLPTPVAMPVDVTATLAGGPPNTTFTVYFTPTTFQPPAPAPGTFTSFGSFTTNATGAGTITTRVIISIPSQIILLGTVNLVLAGAPSQPAAYTKTVALRKICD